jgi:hypothetical protein
MLEAAAGQRRLRCLSGCWAPPGIGRVACFAVEAVPQALGSGFAQLNCVWSASTIVPPQSNHKKRLRRLSSIICLVAARPSRSLVCSGLLIGGCTGLLSVLAAAVGHAAAVKL